MTGPKVVALALDAPNQRQLDRWIADGMLPNIAALMRQGTCARHSHEKRYRNERCWNIFLSGCDLELAGSAFEPDTYRYYHTSIQRERTPVFYGLGEAHRICLFDLPAPISDAVSGVQLTGWASALNAIVPMSEPPGLLDELVARHGGDPKLDDALDVIDGETGAIEKSFRNPNIYRDEDLHTYRDYLLQAIERRTAICLDLLEREDWSLFLALLGESHTANHLFWHCGQAFPMPPGLPDHEDALLAVFKATDEAVGEIAARLDPDTYLMLFTIDDCGQNVLDVPSMALLPEALYRWNFPGSAALAHAELGGSVPPRRTDYAEHWKHELWASATAHGRDVLRSPHELEAGGEGLNWNPAIWYQDRWPDMKAFALPPVSDGHIRINVAGREARGSVDPKDFSAVMDEIEAMLSELTDPRDGQPVVDRVIRTRSDPHSDGHIPPDMIVCWCENRPFDAIESARIGRVGPVPFFRTGGHRTHGTMIDNWMVVRGPDIAAGASVPAGKLEDVSATILELMGADSPYPIEGRPLIVPHRANVAA